MSRGDREGWLPREGAVLPPCGKTEGVLQIDKMRIKCTLKRICPRAAPSVTAYAATPSSKRKAFALSVICFANASSPKGRAEKSVRTARANCKILSQNCTIFHRKRKLFIILALRSLEHLTFKMTVFVFVPSISMFCKFFLFDYFFLLYPFKASNLCYFRIFTKLSHFLTETFPSFLNTNFTLQRE